MPHWCRAFGYLHVGRLVSPENAINGSLDALDVELLCHPIRLAKLQTTDTRSDLQLVASLVQTIYVCNPRYQFDLDRQVLKHDSISLQIGEVLLWFGGVMVCRVLYASPRQRRPRMSGILTTADYPFSREQRAAVRITCPSFGSRRDRRTAY